MTIVPDWLDEIVSRETLEDLEKFHALFLRWNAKINLVSRSSAPELWNRHIWDSAQVWQIAPKAAHWADFGSGGGFPAIICAIFAKNTNAETRFTLVESDQRKATFLRTALRELDLNATVVAKRVESLDSLGADIISARALSRLTDLFEFVAQHMTPGGQALFPKGEIWQTELEEAQKTWTFDYKAHTSHTDAQAAVLQVKELKRG
ncbi:16S rRNA (guanine(527)-N(7))-methyltransferase RsmG [Pseudosulfitobacter sp. DSM 107133]|uniref:16S rRNA (guanine(527)-N(7))-methyltransferase RsmG n=1 Tax=Pseudosulfitobacter sp. DSM 107133 TaxID=2883100 RepID=UPI000DF2C595|nr:16S rRNA (guanine(527)-N(7))-methyltransferase RsmG [Pseudosulfitobacter sp. DSM 107133]UOA25378.1 Ribosomal RNA small subunit methyltransferase G [Pseudosulfitobacter sp. DSM 107133]